MLSSVSWRLGGDIVIGDYIAPVTRTTNATAASSHCCCDGFARLVCQAYAVLGPNISLDAFSSSCTILELQVCRHSSERQGSSSLMSSTPHQFRHELIEYANLTSPNMEQERTGNQTLRQAAVPGEPFAQAPGQRASQHRMPFDNVPHNGRCGPAGTAQSTFAVRRNGQSRFSGHMQEQAYPVLPHAHGPAASPYVDPLSQQDWHTSGYQQPPAGMHLTAAVSSVGQQRYGWQQATALSEAPNFAHPQGQPSYHAGTQPRAYTSEGAYTADQPQYASCGVPTFSGAHSHLPMPQLAPDLFLTPSPTRSHLDLPQFEDTQTTSPRSPIASRHSPAPTLMQIPDGRRMHHPILTYAFEEQHAGDDPRWESLTLIYPPGDDDETKNGSVIGGWHQPQSGEQFHSSLVASSYIVKPFIEEQQPKSNQKHRPRLQPPKSNHSNAHTPASPPQYSPTLSRRASERHDPFTRPCRREQ